MKTNFATIPALGALVLGALMAQGGWTTYSSAKHGFSMLIPQGTRMADKEYGDGWAGANGNHDGVEFHGVAKLGIAAEADIVRFGVQYTGIGEDHWDMVDQGRDFKVYKARQGDKAVLAAVVVGTKAGFLLFLRTTDADLNEHKTDYEKWYKSVKIQ